MTCQALSGGLMSRPEATRLDAFDRATPTPRPRPIEDTQLPRSFWKTEMPKALPTRSFGRRRSSIHTTGGFFYTPKCMARNWTCMWPYDPCTFALRKAVDIVPAGRPILAAPNTGTEPSFRRETDLSEGRLEASFSSLYEVTARLCKSLCDAYVS
ncbi:hypothetical protein NUW54_g9570 [Trametes sanguinea]|uniref:Uncharacterized protein n=1 Tax=Trametes sanguinea TaxID=158606 RepID=A0ACC1P5P1_9APHY|nr:hypothetical protein NUW54_g9570 [Trametes sanguinea]